MAEVVRLDGKNDPVEPAKADQRVAALLDDLATKNHEGDIKGIAVIYITQSGSWASGWMWPTMNRDPGFPWDLAMRGALQALAAEINASVIDIGEDDSGSSA